MVSSMQGQLSGYRVNQAPSSWTGTETVTNSYPLLVFWVTRCESRPTMDLSKPHEIPIIGDDYGRSCQRSHSAGTGDVSAGNG